jgi:dienelactone hydrolase
VQDESTLAQRLATSAIALARSGVRPKPAAVVLRGFSHGRRTALELARARCLAAVDQHAGDMAARRAADLLSEALNEHDG